MCFGIWSDTAVKNVFQKLLSAPLLVILVIYQHTAVCILGVCFKDRQVMDNAGHALGYECVQSVK